MNDQLTFLFDQAAPAAAATVEPAAEVGSEAATPTTPRSRLELLERPLGDARPASLLACVEWAADRLGPNDAEAKQLRGAVRTLLKVIHKRTDPGAADLPANPALLRAHLLGAMPAAMQLSQKRWENAKSRVKTLLITTGWVPPDARAIKLGQQNCGPLSHLLQGREVDSSLRPFLRFCEREGIASAAIDAAAVEAYEAWLTGETLDLRPRSTVNSISCAWRRLQRLFPEWPRQDLKLQTRVRQKAAPYAAFPPSFEQDVTAYLAALRNPDPLDGAQGRPLAEISVQHVRRYLMRAATYLMQSGTPACEIFAIRCLVEPRSFRAILLALHADGQSLLKAAGENSQWTSIAYCISLTLLQAARRWVRLPMSVLTELGEMQKMVKPRRGGLSNKVQDALAELMTDEERAELHALPWRAFDMAETMLRDGGGSRAAKLHETALALAIVLQHPMRARDLAALDPACHFRCDKRGVVQQVHVTASKTKAQLRFEVEPELARRMERHIAAFRPYISCSGKMTALFPGEGGKPRAASTLTRNVGRLVTTQLGKKFTLHLARHLAVDMMLDADPGNIGGAQRLLGHKNPKVTLEVYASRITLASNRGFQQIVRDQAARARIAMPGQRPNGSRGGQR